METLITKLSQQANLEISPVYCDSNQEVLEKLIVTVVEACREQLVELYQATPLELCGILLDLDQRIVDHFYARRL